MSFAWRGILVVVVGASVFAPLDLKAEDLDLRIAPAHVATFAEIRDAREWRNPYIAIQATGIEVRSAAIPNGRTSVPVEELRTMLIRLPVSAWPYGRIVAGQGASIAGLNDREAIARNRRAVEQVLESLGVVVNWWPS